MNHAIGRVGAATAALAAATGLAMVSAGTAAATPPRWSMAAKPAPPNCTVGNLCLYDHQNNEGPDGGILRLNTPGAINLQDFQYKHESDWRDKARSAYNNTSHTVTLSDTQGSSRVTIRTLQPGEGGNIPQVVDFVEIGS